MIFIQKYLVSIFGNNCHELLKGKSIGIYNIFLTDKTICNIWCVMCDAWYDMICVMFQTWHFVRSSLYESREDQHQPWKLFLWHFDKISNEYVEYCITCYFCTTCYESHKKKRLNMGITRIGWTPPLYFGHSRNTFDAWMTTFWKIRQNSVNFNIIGL